MVYKIALNEKTENYPRRIAEVASIPTQVLSYVHECNRFFSYFHDLTINLIIFDSPSFCCHRKKIPTNGGTHPTRKYRDRSEKTANLSEL